MDRDHLTRLIDDPARVQRDDIADLKAMAERYPWFSGAHLLLAVGGHREGDVLFDEQLRASAAHLPSRAVLFDRLHVPDRTPIPQAAPKPPTPAFVTSPTLVPDEPVRHEGSVHYAEDVDSPVPGKIGMLAAEQEAPVVVPAPPRLLEDPPTEVPAPTLLEAITPADKAIPEAAGPVPTPPVSSDHFPAPWKERLLRGDPDEEELDRQMRDSAVAISYELLLEQEGLLEIPPVEQPPRAVPEPLAQSEPQPAAAQPAPAGSRSFSDWLSAGSTDAAPIAPKEPARSGKSATAPHRVPAARPVVDPEIIRAVHQLPPIEPKHAPETAETKALVERFIKQNTGQASPPKKAEFFNPQTAAKRSLEEHADLVTETLARIYEKQGNIAKAIAAYERLAVKHPEKSAHFRALAKALAGR